VPAVQRLSHLPFLWTRATAPAKPQQGVAHAPPAIAVGADGVLVEVIISREGVSDGRSRSIQSNSRPMMKRDRADRSVVHRNLPRGIHVESAVPCMTESQVSHPKA